MYFYAKYKGKYVALHYVFVLLIVSSEMQPQVALGVYLILHWILGLHLFTTATANTTRRTL